MSDNFCNDTELADKLKRENPGQFHTLVRMHLSFVLDLNTDDNETVYEKAKFKKWSLFPKKSKCQIRGIMDGAPLTQEGICQVYQLIEFLSKEHNICQEGIFRRTGSLARQQELRNLLNSGRPLNLDAGHYSVHDCASVLKGFLAELPEPLLTDVHYPAHCQIAELCGIVDKNMSLANEPRLLRSLQLLLLLLPVENRVLLKDVLILLNYVASFESHNKMSADSLATLFTPHLLCPRKLSPEELHINSQTLSGIVSYMIQKCVKLFDIPPKLATDIRAYFVERERKKVFSPHNELNESISDSTAANTVYSFLDRERTAQAHISNSTEAALAQLYAYIQSLPESSKKRKLIKQFNKENGQGTPLQVQRTQKKEIRSKNIGDSIKKHIFQKSLNKTIQKQNKSVLTTVDIAVKTSNIETVKTDLSKSHVPSKVRIFTDTFNDDSKHSSLLSSPDSESKYLDPSNVDTNNIKQDSLCNCLHNSQKEISQDDISAKAKISSDTICNACKCPISTKKCIENSSKNSLNDVNLEVSTECVNISNNTSTHVKHNCSCNIQNTIWNNYVTSTPAGHRLPKPIGTQDGLFTPHISRKSMSPITRSAHGMSIAMQETMMTPRSRKPVLLISNTNICQLAAVKKNGYNASEYNSVRETLKEENTDVDSHDILIETKKTINTSISTNSDIKITKDTIDSVSEECCSELHDIPNDDSSFEEMSKDELSSLSDPNVSVDKSGEILADSKTGEKISKTRSSSSTSNSLSNNFREYLQSRSVYSPEDESFSSRTDDFDSTMDFNSSDKLSDSLLYCLNGNEPNEQNSSKLTNCSGCSDISPKRKREVEEHNFTTRKPPNNKIFSLKVRKVDQTGDVVFETSL